MRRRQIGLIARTRWAQILLKNLKDYVNTRTIAPDVPGWMPTPAGLVPVNRPGGLNSAANYPFKMIPDNSGGTPKVKFEPGTITAAQMDSNYDGTPTVGGTLISATEKPTLSVTGTDMRAWYKTTWEGIADGGGPGAILVDAELQSAEILLYDASSPPSQVAPTIDASDGSPDVTGEFYLQIGLVQIVEGTQLRVFNDSVRSSHRIVFCPDEDFRPYPIS